MGSNLGPSGAAYYGLKYLSEEGYDLIYWVDDDDPPKVIDTVERLRKIFTHSENKNIGCVGAVGARWDWKKGESIRLSDTELHGVVDVDVIGGSAHLIIHSSVVKTIGLPVKDLFFGYEEFDYCLRAKQAGFRILVDGDLMKEYRVLAGRLNLKIHRTVSNISPVRRYYSTRSYIYIMLKEFHRSDLALRESCKAFIRCLLCWKHGFKYGITFVPLQISAVLDGYLGRLGKRETPTK